MSSVEVFNGKPKWVLNAGFMQFQTAELTSPSTAAHVLFVFMLPKATLAPGPPMPIALKASCLRLSEQVKCACQHTQLEQGPPPSPSGLSDFLGIEPQMRPFGGPWGSSSFLRGSQKRARSPASPTRG